MVMLLETKIPELSSSEVTAKRINLRFSDISHSPPAKEEVVSRHSHAVAEHANDLR